MSSIASNKMTTGCHDRRCHRCMFWSWSKADLDTSAATQKKKLVASINTSMSYSVKRLSLYCDFKIWQASQAQVQLQHHVSLRKGFSFSSCRNWNLVSLSSQIHHLWRHADTCSCSHRPLASLLRRRRDYSHTSTILWLYSKDGRSVF